MKLLILLLLISFPLGHLARIEITSGVALYVHDIVAASMLLAVFIDSVKKRTLPSGRLTVPILMFFLVATLSLLMGVNTVEPRQAVIGGLYLVRWIAHAGVYFYLLKYLRIHKDLTFLRRTYTLREALLISGLVLATFGLTQYVLFPDLTQLKWLGWDDHYYRLAGTILDPGFTGILLVLTAFLALETKLTRKVKLVAVSMPVAALLLTYSRASYLAFLLGSLVFAFMKRKLRKALIIGAIFLGTLFLLPQAQSEGTNLLRLYSLFQRIETWNQAVVIVREHPVFGVGFNLMRSTKRQYGFVGEDWKTSHSASGIDNSYLFVSATTGFIGLAAYLTLLYRMIRLGLKDTKRKQTQKASMLASISAVSIHALFNNTWFYPWVMLWMWYLLAETEAGQLRKITTLQK